jgi:hypothetical protein
MSKIIYDAINDEVLESIVGPDLIKKGWTQVIRNPPWSEKDPYGWHRWFDSNIHGQYRAFDYAIYFQDEEDAVLYNLRWS